MSPKRYTNNYDEYNTINYVNNNNGGLISLYSRTIIISNDINLGSNYTPPTLEQLAASVLDINHTSMISSGLYTQNEVNTLRNDSINYFKTQFDIDFSLGFLAPNGIIILSNPNFIMFPYTSGVNTLVQVTFDDKNIERGVTGDWFGYQYGEVILSNATGIFSGGLHIGESYIKGDVLAYFDYNLIKTKGENPNASQQREKFRVRSPWLSKNILNSQGYVDSLSKLEILDSNNNVGFFQENIVFIKDVNTNITYEKLRVVATW